MKRDHHPDCRLYARRLARVLSLSLVLATIPLAVPIAGCGGGSTAAPTLPVVTNSVYAGEWHGRWINSTRNHTGILDITVGKDGVGTGTTYDNGMASQGVITLRFQDDGQFAGTIQYRSGTCQISGRMDAYNSGPFNQDFPSERCVGTLTLEKR